MQPRTAALLEDILEAIRYIREDTVDMVFEVFDENRRARQLVVYNLLTIGEAVSRLRRDDPPVVERLSGYNQAVGLRNALIHGYDVIDYRRVWDTVQESLPVLRAEVEELLMKDST